MRQKYQLGLFLLLLVGCLVIYARHGAILTAEPHQVLGASGDPFNAYYIVEWHAKYDSTFTSFEGMQYPYGDHVVINSVIPLLSNSMQFLRKAGWDVSRHTVRILHYSMLFSYLIAAVFLYLIFKRLNISPGYALVVALGMVLLSPQTGRLFGHFGLAHIFPIPATLYGLMRFDERPGWRTSIGLLIIVLWSSLIQFYFFGITALMIAGFYFFSFLKKWKTAPSRQFPWSELNRYGIHFLVQVIVPYVAFSWWIAQYPVPGRPEQPLGFLAYITYWEGLFTTLRMPWFGWINENIIEIRNVNGEGRGYVGLVATVMFVYMLVFWIKNKFRRSFFEQLIAWKSYANEQAATRAETKLTRGLDQLVYDDADFLQRLFAMSVLLLAISFGLPFSLPGLDFLLDYIGPLAQFRSPGRLNWVFFFVLNIIAFVYLYRRFRHQKWWLLVPLLILVLEAWQFQRTHHYDMIPIAELKAENTYPKRSAINFSEYQAILPIPFYHVGTDHFSVSWDAIAQQQSTILSKQTGLPLLSCLGNRVSVSRAYQAFQLVTEPYRKPTILEDFKDDRPILLMLKNNKKEDFPFLKEAVFLETLGEFGFYQLPLTAFEKAMNRQQEAIREEIRQDSILQQQISDKWAADSASPFVYEGFEGGKSEGYRGKGASYWTKKRKEFYRTRLEGFQKGSNVTLSFWTRMDVFPNGVSFFYIVQQDGVTGAVLKTDFPQIRNFITTMDTNGWCLVEFTFELKGEAPIIAIQLENKGFGLTIPLDELLIRPADTDVYLQNEVELGKNNRYYPGHF